MKKISTLTSSPTATTPLLAPQNLNSLTEWMQLYCLLKAKVRSPATQQAKIIDLTRFLNFYHQYTNSDDISLWIAPITKAFQDDFRTQCSKTTGTPYKTTTINRTMQTLKHFSSWLTTRRALTAGNPTKDITNLTEDEPEWKGLTNEEIKALERACQERRENSNGKQAHLLETALLYCLLHTGLRISELTNLNCDQHHNGGFHHVLRKNNRISTFIPLTPKAESHLKAYIGSRTAPLAANPLFLSSFGNRLSARNTRQICDRVSAHARQFLSNPSFRFTPHQLRHSFLKRITDKHGIHFAHRISGNVSIKEIFRYAKPSSEEVAACIGDLF